MTFKQNFSKVVFGTSSRMKKSFKIVCLILLCGVFGVDGDKVESVTVIAGDLVTMKTGLTELQEDDVIWWRFGEGESKGLLAEIAKHKIWYTRERFKDKLQILDSYTGDLTIMNMKIKYSGLYEAELNIANGTKYRRFYVNVIDSPLVIDSGHEMTSISVTEGESVTINTDVRTHKDDLILWRFGDENVLIVEGDVEDDKISYLDVDERFKNRLKLNDETASLTITNSKTEHSGLYQLKISSNKQAVHKTFNVVVKGAGLSSGGIAGLCLFFLLVIAGVMAAGFILYRRRISELQLKSVSVVEGESVTLHTYINEDQIQPDTTVIQWTYEDKLIAKFDTEITYEDVDDERFKDRLKLYHETGSLSISNLQSKDAGLYEVKITSGKKTLKLKFNLYLTERIRPSKLAESVTLDTCVTEIQKDDEILWMFGGTPIAQYIGGSDQPTLMDTDERFKGKLEVNHHTGDLTIRNIRAEQTGGYTVKIKNSCGTKNRTMNVAFSVQAVKGESFTLFTKLKMEDSVQVKWISKDKTTLVTGMKGDGSKTNYTTDLRFRDRLKMNHETGDLTIRNIKQIDEGVYTLQLINTDGIIINSRIYNIDVVAKGNILNQQNSERTKTVKLGESLTLDTGVNKIQKDDEILWMFGDMRLAQFMGCSNESTLYDYIDERFKDRLEVNNRTGDLIIRNFRTEHSGVYKVQIKNSNGTKERKFNVAFGVRATNGESVVLPTKVKIKEGDEVEWTSKDKTILVTGMNGDNNKTSYTDDERYRNRLEVNHETGDLMITNLSQTDIGVYTLQVINTNGRKTNRIFDLHVVAKPKENNQEQSDFERIRTVKFAESVTLDTGVTKIQKDDEMLWMYGNVRLAQYIGGNDNHTLFNTDENFKHRLQLNHQTGDLTIRNIKTELTGFYTVQVKNNNGTKERKFSVAFNVEAVKGRSVTLPTKVTIEEGDEVEWTAEDKTILVTRSNGESKETSYTDDVKYRNRLEMNPETGDLTIRNIRQSDEGVYKLQLNKTGKTISRIFNINLVSYNILNQQKSERITAVKAGKSLTLNSGVTEIQKDDQILWMFGAEDVPLVEYIGDPGGTYMYTISNTDQRFKGIINLNYQTGDLIIRSIRPDHSGVYKVQIKNSSGIKEREIEVAFQIEAIKGQSVVIPTKLKIEEGDEVKWTSKDKTVLVFGMNGDNNETTYTDDETYKNRLDMNAQTGDLMIRNIRETDVGNYKLQLIKTDGKITSNRIFDLCLVDSAGNDVTVETTPLLQQSEYYN